MLQRWHLLREATGRRIITNVSLWWRGEYPGGHNIVLLFSLLTHLSAVYAGTPNFVNCTFRAGPLVGAVSSMVELHRTFLLREQHRLNCLNGKPERDRSADVILNLLTFLYNNIPNNRATD